MPTNQFSVSDQTALITGGSRGIGNAIAYNFARDGADVIICAPERERENLENTADEFNEAYSGRTLPVVCDITDRRAVERMLEIALDEFDQINTLVNNAGGSRTFPFEEFPVEDWEFVIDLNINGTYNVTQIVGEHLRTGDHSGNIINIASVAGMKGYPTKAPYGIVKSGIINFTETLSYEWAYDGVRVNAVAPGPISTRRVANTHESPMPDPEEIEREEIPRRVGKPEEIADIVQLLASPASSYINGQTLPVAGIPHLEREWDVSKDDNPWNW